MNTDKNKNLGQTAIRETRGQTAGVEIRGQTAIFRQLREKRSLAPRKMESVPITRIPSAELANPCNILILFEKDLVNGKWRKKEKDESQEFEIWWVIEK
jgi:hypothetical protein